MVARGAALPPQHVFLSSACTYALRAVLRLSTAAPEAVTSIRALSDELGLPYPFLAKTVQTLVRAGLLESVRGKAGGVRLARPAETIRLKEVVLAVDGPAVFTECVLGLPGCGATTPCPVHAEWVATRAGLERTFGRATLADLAGPIAAGRSRLTAAG